PGFIPHASILRELANCLYESRTCTRRTFQRKTPANSLLAKESAGALPAPGLRRSGQGRGVRRVYCQEDEGQPAHRKRTFEGFAARGAGARQAHQTVDVL